MAAKKKRKKPFDTVKVGSVTIPITKSTNQRGYTSYVAPYNALGKRRFITGSDLKKVRREAKNVAAEIANQKFGSSTISPTEREEYTMAKNAVAAAGLPLVPTLIEHISLMKKLGDHGSLRGAVNFYLKHKAAKKPKPVHEAIDEFIQAKRETEVAPNYLKQLETHLRKLRDFTNTDLQSLDQSLVRSWIAGQDVSIRAKNNLRAVILALIAHARREKWIDKTHDFDIEMFGTKKTRRPKVEIYTPSEFRKLMAACRPELKAFLVINAFSGVRAEEIQKLDYSALDLKADVIHVTEDISKNGNERYPPILPNLKAWLRQLKKTKGPIVQFVNLAQQLRWLGQDAGVPWKKNGLRHSYGSYRSAVLHDFGRVAFEMDNSVGIVKRHYNKPRLKEQGEEWFSIRPQKQAKVTSVSFSKKRA